LQPQAFGEVAAEIVLSQMQQFALQVDPDLAADVDPTAARRPPLTPWSRAPPGCGLIISDPDARAERLRQRFALTQAEAAFALEIVKRDGRKAAADRLGITVGTARSHLSVSSTTPLQGVRLNWCGCCSILGAARAGEHEKKGGHCCPPRYL
jgi:hypothetical protein